MKKQVLSKEIVQKALDSCNGSVKNAAKKLERPCVTVYWWIKKENLNVNINGIKASKEEVQKLYDKHQSIRKVSKVLNCTAEGVRVFMHRNNLNINELNLCDVDHDFFSREEEKVFYWAGFLAADGCVMERQGRSNNRYVLSLGLSIKDLNHLEKFKKDIKSEHKICKDDIEEIRLKNEQYESSSTQLVKKIFPACSIKFDSKKIFKDLGKFNIKPRKSLVYKMPDWLCRHKFVNHFIRGYFDGDGSVWTALGKNRKVKQVMFAVYGGERLCEQIGEIINKNCDIPGKRNLRNREERLYMVEYGGNGVMSKITDFLYKDATVYLDRKYERMMMSKGDKSE